MVAWYWARSANIRGVGPAGRWLMMLRERGRRSSASMNGGKKDSTGYKVKRKDFHKSKFCGDQDFG